MKRTRLVLQKKLKELESEINVVLSIHSSEPSIHQLLSESIYRKFKFLKNLLTRETESHPHKPNHLKHIQKRLNKLETIFHDWVTFKNTSPSLDSASSCSCSNKSHSNSNSNSNSNGDDNTWFSDMGSRVFDEEGDEEEFMPDLISCEDGNAVAEMGMVVERDIEGEKRERRRKRRWFGNKTLVLVFCLGVFMAHFFGFYHGNEDTEFFLRPT